MNQRLHPEVTNENGLLLMRQQHVEPSNVGPHGEYTVIISKAEHEDLVGLPLAMLLRALPLSTC